MDSNKSTQYSKTEIELFFKERESFFKELKELKNILRKDEKRYEKNVESNEIKASLNAQ